MSRRTDEATERRIIALYALGYRVRDVMAEVGVSRQTVYTVLRRNSAAIDRRTP